jgi:hypothetical protein
MASVVPSALSAMPCPVWPWSTPPHPKWSDAPVFEAFRYAACLTCTVAATAADEPDCAPVRITMPPSPIDTTIAIAAMPNLMAAC